MPFSVGKKGECSFKAHGCYFFLDNFECRLEVVIGSNHKNITSNYKLTEKSDMISSFYSDQIIH